MSVPIKRYFLFPFIVLILAMAAAAVSSTETHSQRPAQDDPPQRTEPRFSPGNYCISCHLAEDTRLASVTEWKGGIGREVNSPCPAATAIHKEEYYTERMLLMIDRAGGAEALTEKMRGQLEAQTQAYSRLLEAPVTSLEAFTSEAQTIRYRLNKVYTALNQGIEAEKKTGILLLAIVVSFAVLGSLIWGWVNTRSFTGRPSQRRMDIIPICVFLLVVVGIFTLPLFRLSPAVTAVTTPEQQEAQSVIDEAERAASSADRAQARAWMLARLAAADPAHADKVFHEAASALQEARASESALWGDSLAVQEANIVPSIQLEKARLVALDLNAARSRQWSLPLIAVEWAKVDKQSATSMLDVEERSLAAGKGLYRDLQLRGVALAWVWVEPARALPSAKGITDPAIRSWTQREIGIFSDDPAAFEDAGGSARLIVDPVQRARSLRELAAVTREKPLFDEALNALQEVKGESLAYALSDLALAMGSAAPLVEKIDPTYPEALTFALLRSENPQLSYNAAMAITDPVERARAAAELAGRWGDAEAAMRIEMQPYRDLALRDVTLKTGNVSLTNSINSVYYKVEALTGLGQTAAAMQEAAGLKDSYPLVGLGTVLVRTDPQTALTLVDGMTREIDKAYLLQWLAARDPALFEQALGMALAARVRGDALAPAQASLILANWLWTSQPENAWIAWEQALEAARRITIK